MKQSYWPKLIIAYLCVLFIYNANGQGLLKSRRSSFFTYVYKISSAEARQIHKAKPTWKPDSAFFHTKIDSFPTDEVYEKSLPQGHYLEVFAKKNKINVALKSVQNFDAFILNNNTDLRIQLYDLQGSLITDADIRINRKKIGYKENEKAYILKKTNKNGLLEITVNNFTAFYELERRYNNSTLKRYYRKLFYETPFKYLYRPIKFIVNVPIDGVKSLISHSPRGTIYSIKEFAIRSFYRTACLFDEYYCEDYYYRNTNFKGYFALNKPKYKPGDTVRFKAFVVNKKGKPIDKELSASIYFNGKTNDILKVIPYRSGGYESEFVLNDSLDLRLDRSYRINLRDNKGIDYSSGYFRYEDYELKTINLTVRSKKEDHNRYDSVSLFAKATDQNDLSVLDGRLEILISPTYVNKVFKTQIFMPDTLFFKELALDPSGETPIVIDDKSFPAANFNYNVQVKLITSDNEIVTENKRLEYFYRKEDFKIKVQQDSIYFTYESNGNEQAKEVKIYEEDNFGNQTLAYQGKTPATIHYDEYFSRYLIESDSISKSVDLSKKPSLLRCIYERTSDSLFIQVQNPRNLAFGYSIYKHNSEIASGYNTKLNFKRKINSKKNYFISLQYLWGGKVIEEDYKISLKEKILQLEVIQPKVVYPGQSTKIDIKVTDINGEPMEGVDLTAFSFTKKFKSKPPKVPYLGNEKKQKELINRFNLEEKISENAYQDELDYSNWKVQAKLDSIEYYKFIYPEDSIRKYAYYPADSVTQFSPFIFENGEAIPVHVVYVDSSPVYFSWSTHTNPYSFQIDSGWHQIKLRTSDKILTIDSIYFKPYQRLLTSVDAGSKHKQVTINESSHELSNQEKNFLYNYIFPYRRNFGTHYAYLKSGKNVQLLNGRLNYGDLHDFAGPVAGNISYHLVDSFSLSYSHEPFFEYDFAPKILKMRSVNDIEYPKFLKQYEQNQRLEDEVITEQKIKKNWQDYLNAKRKSRVRYDYPIQTLQGAGQMVLNYTKEEKKSDKRPINFLVFRYDDQEFLRIYPGRVTHLHQLRKGFYKLIFIYEDAQYHVKDSVYIKENGRNYIKYRKPLVLQKDNFSIVIDSLLEENIFNKLPDKYKAEKEKKQIFNQYRKRFKYLGVGNIINGRVYDAESGEVLPGVNILVKGTNYGATTNIDGNYSLKVPLGYNKLLFSFIGMKRKEIEIDNRSIINVDLLPDVKQLTEVIVTGAAKVKSYTVSLTDDIAANRLQGQIAGVNINTDVPGAAVQIKLRGNTSINLQNAPLYIVNGQIFLGDVNEINPEFIKNLDIYRGEKAISLYGSRAANGVIVLEIAEAGFKNLNSQVTNNNNDTFLETTLQSNSIRDDFSDYAFWKPRLRTNEKGIASFETVFPDDITSWKTFYLAMNNNRYSGQSKGLIKSYKPLMAQLAAPSFLVEDDSVVAIGKTLNYLKDTLNVETRFEVNGILRKHKVQKLTDRIIDSLYFNVNTDTLALKYFLEKSDGYYDGERREIPVFKKGIQQTIGLFSVLNQDTTVNLDFDPKRGDITLYLQTDLLEVVDDEIQHLIDYQYLCNEQIASKLKALLIQKKIAQHRNQTFENDKEVKKLVRLLLSNQSENNLWGWWKNIGFNSWISLHVLEALIKAQEMGYTVSLQRENIIQYLIWKLSNDYTFTTGLKIIKILMLLDAEINYASYIHQLEQKNNGTLNALLELMFLKLTLGFEYDLDILFENIQITALGGVYVEHSESTKSLLTNDLQNTLLAYKILRSDSLLHEELLRKIRIYFLAKRGNGHWRNTYESSLIIDTILPDILQSNKKIDKTAIQLSGDTEKTISTFPFKLKIQGDKKVAVSKQGGFPIYFTAYQRYWENNPIVKSDDFEIETYFEDNINRLKAGKPVSLFVKVTANKEAEYTMINVPIPSSCSYVAKPNRIAGESHREYFKHKTTIFIERLTKGEHIFEIKLRPRYAGKYTLNPAKIELMYFPTFSANNAIKQVEVR